MKLGSLCSGAGGLDLAVEAVFGARTVWHCETDKAASKVLAHRWPGVPNHGDLITTDWAAVEPVDIMAFGWPCQPFSMAGKRKGHKDERAIWPHIAGAVRILRPRFCVLENVSAVLAVGEFQRVASDLAAFGYDLRWVCVRASDVGAPHRRERFFAIAYDRGAGLQGPQPSGHGEALPEHVGDSRPAADSDSPGGEAFSGRQGSGITGRLQSVECGSTDWQWPAADSARDGWHEGRPEPARLERGFDAAVSGAGPVDLLPTPNAQDGNGGRYSSEGHQSTLPGEVRLLPTPAAADGERGQDYARAGRDGSGGDDLITCIAKTHLLPTPKAHDGEFATPRTTGRPIEKSTHLQTIASLEQTFHWGKYGAAIARWETVLGRSAPTPTELNRNGKPRLNPEFSSWMMGWPEGWVTDPELGIKRSDQLRIIGNGVVPQQAIAALAWLLNIEAAA